MRALARGAATPLAEARDSRLGYAPLCGGLSTCATRSRATGLRRSASSTCCGITSGRARRSPCSSGTCSSGTPTSRRRAWRGAGEAARRVAERPRSAARGSGRLRSAAGAGQPGDPPRRRGGRPRRRRPLVSGAGQPGDLRDHPAAGPGSREVIESQRGRVRGPRPGRARRWSTWSPSTSSASTSASRLGTDHPGVGWSDTRAAGRARRRPCRDRTASRRSSRWCRRDAPAEGCRARGRDLHRRLQARARRLPSGALARVNPGSHYGFVEDGVVLSKLQPGPRHALRARRRTRRDEDVDGAGRRRCSSASAPPGRTASPLLERDARTGGAVPGRPGRAAGARQLVGLADRQAPHGARRALPAGVAAGGASSSTATSRAPRPRRWPWSSRPTAAGTRCTST